MKFLLAKEQRIGAAVLCGIALIGWFIVAVHPDRAETQDSPETPKKRSWAERKDSIRQADSLRYVQWKEEREARYDSFRLADSLRHAAWRAERQQRWDSMRTADSIWMDSVGIPYFLPRVKKDTVLDLNHCDTAELQLIRGIGRYTAVQIVRYRERLGGFYSPQQLTDEIFSKLSLDTLLHHFTVDTTAIRPIPVNSCSIDRLSRHPYIRYEQAKAIYHLRRSSLKINSLNDLRSLSQISESELQRIAPYLAFE